MLPQEGVKEEALILTKRPTEGGPGAQSSRLSRERALEASWQACQRRAFTAQAGAFSPGPGFLV
ncbi:MAG: hypothetical protein DRI61_00265 [Chloroflexi bacterium]|nr:MAG: hypothetical protein DRI61_00265 [Chloroflexota bacterium]